MKVEPKRSSKDRRRFLLKNTSAFLEVTFRHLSRRGERQVSFDTSLPEPRQNESLTATKCQEISQSLASGGSVPQEYRQWLADLLSAIYFNISFTSSPDWDLRSALGFQKQKGRPNTASARDLYIALYFRFGRALKIRPEKLVDEIEEKFTVKGESLDLAKKRWGKETSSIVAALLKSDAEEGLDPKRSINEYRNGLRQSIMRCVVMADSHLPGVEPA